MEKEKANQIFEEVKKEWVRVYGEKFLDPVKLEAVKLVLQACPHEDGLLRVTSMETGNTHLVPIQEVILNGLKGDELHRFPLEK